MAQRLSARRAPFVLLALLLTACSARGGSSEFSWVREELFFGLNIPAGGVVTDSAWQVFQEQEIAPRLPDGFTIIPSTGYYRNSSTGQTEREPSRILLVLYRDDQPEIARRLDELASTYKRRFNQQSVLRTSARIRATF